MSVERPGDVALRLDSAEFAVLAGFAALASAGGFQKSCEQWWLSPQADNNWDLRARCYNQNRQQVTCSSLSLNR